MVSADVAACQASVDAVLAACPGDMGRRCIYQGIRPLCMTGHTAFIKTVFDCLQMTNCQTPADPSAAQACVQNVVHAAATSVDHAAGAAICTCQGSSPQAGCSASEPSDLATLMLMNESDVSAYTTCLQTMGCAAMNTACLDASPLGTANACP